MASPSPATVQPSQDVVSRRLGDTTVLVHLPTNRIFELNDTGGRIWELLTGGSTRDQVVDRLVTEFDIARDDATAALNDLLDDLSAAGLLGR